MNSIQWLEPARPARQSGAAVSIGSSANKGKTATKAIAITVYKKTMKRLRWAVGDRVLVGWDSTMIYLRRSPNGTHQLTGANTTQKKNKTGQMETATVVFTRPDGFHFPALSERVYFDDGQFVEDGTTIGIEYPTTAREDVLSFGSAAKARR
jgi:hypothetical protein